jgi:hypothetical protein
MTNLHFPETPLDRSRPEPDSKSAEPGNAAPHTTPSCTNIQNDKSTAQMTSSAVPYNETRITTDFADPVAGTVLLEIESDGTWSLHKA